MPYLCQSVAILPNRCAFVGFHNRRKEAINPLVAQALSVRRVGENGIRWVTGCPRSPLLLLPCA